MTRTIRIPKPADPFAAEIAAMLADKRRHAEMREKLAQQAKDNVSRPTPRSALQAIADRLLQLSREREGDVMRVKKMVLQYEIDGEDGEEILVVPDYVTALEVMTDCDHECICTCYTDEGADLIVLLLNKHYREN